MAAKTGLIKLVSKITSGPMKTPDPFLFCVYHKDMFPAGNEKMQAPRRGNGMDFNPSAPYRMYHGSTVPGFPQHPHRGFETITATIPGSGYIDHTDSTGACGRYGDGDLQWMTAGKGIVHAEMFPLINTKKENPLKFFQIWLNLPKKNKMVDPHFIMHWSENVCRTQTPDGKVKATVWAGELLGKKGLASPPNSWAADPKNDVALWFLELLPGGSIKLPTAMGKDTNRALYFLEGSKLSVGGQDVGVNTYLEVDSSQEAELSNTDSKVAEVLVLQGKTIGEPVAQHGPFVMNTHDEIQQAFMDYQRTRFGGWPWPADDYVFPRTKGRFAKSSKDAKEEFPPAAGAKPQEPAKEAKAEESKQ